MGNAGAGMEMMKRSILKRDDRVIEELLWVKPIL